MVPVLDENLIGSDNARGALPGHRRVIIAVLVRELGPVLLQQVCCTRRRSIVPAKGLL